jgi:pimeloyl-ACP methyl ester carboxylesterase
MNPAHFQRMMLPRLICAALLALCPAAPLFADGAADNQIENVRRLPPPGVKIPDDVRGELTTRAEALHTRLTAAAIEWQSLPDRARFLPDAEVFWKAVDWALRYDEIYDLKQVEWARSQLAEAETRLTALARDEKPWLSLTGMVVRGYRSRIDGSVQPFGLVVPASFQPHLPHQWRLDCWFHGRGEKLTELDFIHQRTTHPGEFTPPDTIVLHPYGRYCNGSRFAGETDFFEALEIVQRDYRIDDTRMVVRGFSLGGAACWHLAAHHAWRWCAAAPGAGFSETEEFLTTFQNESLQPTPWERKLWNLYDSTAAAANFFNLPTVAYSGETDRQQQAATAMARAMAKEGITLTHIIGPKTAHAYEPGARAEINRRIDALAAHPKIHPEIDVLQTHTLRYNTLKYGRIDSLDTHWQEARIAVSPLDSGSCQVNVSNVSAFSLTLPPGSARARPPAGFGPTNAPPAPYQPTLVIREFTNGPESSRVEIPLPSPQSDGSLTASFSRQNGTWKAGSLPAGPLRKKHGLQGPIDDAFMDSFLFVRPTGTAANASADAWARAEMARAIDHWRRHFRGDVMIKDDTQVTAEDIRSSHLVLWGDPASNAVLATVAARLPIGWSGAEIKAGEHTFPSASHALIAIYPNPLYPEKYVVLNSSFTFREYDYLNNARQTPKLPDWAVIDIKSPPNSRHPGRVTAAGFFGENWELKPDAP